MSSKFAASLQKVKRGQVIKTGRKKKKIERKQELALQRDGKRETRLHRSSNKQSLRYPKKTADEDDEGHAGSRSGAEEDPFIERGTPKWIGQGAMLIEGWCEGDDEEEETEENEEERRQNAGMESRRGMMMVEGLVPFTQ